MAVGCNVAEGCEVTVGCEVAVGCDVGRRLADPEMKVGVAVGSSGGVAVGSLLGVAVHTLIKVDVDTALGLAVGARSMAARASNENRIVESANLSLVDTVTLTCLNDFNCVNV